MILTLQTHNELTRSQARVFYRLFFDEGEDYSAVDHPRVRHFYTVDEVRDFVAGSVERYYTVNERAMEDYEGLGNIEVQMYYVRDDLVENYHELTRTDLKFFNSSTEQLKLIFSSLDKVELIYRLRTTAS